MIRSDWRRGVASKALALAVLLPLAGCDGGGGAPPVSSSREEATVSGSVVYKGNPVNEGTIRFNPANASRRDAPTAIAPIKDGKYTIKAIIGDNSVSCDVPSIAKTDSTLSFASFIYTVPSGQSTYDVDLSKR